MPLEPSQRLPKVDRFASSTDANRAVSLTDSSMQRAVIERIAERRRCSPKSSVTSPVETSKRLIAMYVSRRNKAVLAGSIVHKTRLTSGLAEFCLY